MRPKENQAERRWVMGRWEGVEMVRVWRARRAARVDGDEEVDGRAAAGEGLALSVTVSKGERGEGAPYRSEAAAW